MSDTDPIYYTTTDDAGVKLALRRFITAKDVLARGGRKPVLLLHGASANHQTFTIPREHLPSLAARLVDEDFDPWLLDWRGSGLVVDDPDNKLSLNDPKRGTGYNFNKAAKYDIGEAISRIHKAVGNDDPIAAVGFCMGGGILAEAVARNRVAADKVDCIVLMALGLFYETGIDGRLKSDARILERLVGRAASVDPRMKSTKVMDAPWPADLGDLYRTWPSALRSHSDDDAVDEMCNRLGFMYGMPYSHGNLIHEIHGTERQKPELPRQFGAIPLHMYIHGGQNIRQGHATIYNGDVDPVCGTDQDFVSDTARDRFKRLTKVTLITGALNRVWHRNSIDLMHEWLCRGTSNAVLKFRKHVLPNYAHQDLLWGRRAAGDVFPTIAAALRPDRH
jgi:cholesterol oxidase